METKRSVIFWFRILCVKLFGSVSWTPPAWLKQHRKKMALWLPGIVLAVLACAALNIWLQHRPRLNLIEAHIFPPSITPNEQILEPLPLAIDFRGKGGHEFSTASVAPLGKIGKQIDSGIKISPAIPGQWQWQSDSKLIFLPAVDWPPGQDYRISFDKNLFADHVKMDKYRYEFSTLPFEIVIHHLKVVQDLKDPQVLRIKGTVSFNYPVDANSFKQRARLAMQPRKNDRQEIAATEYPIEIAFDQHQRVAYIESAPLAPSAAAHDVNLVIDQGVHAMHGSSKTQSAVEHQMFLPYADSFLRVIEIDAGIERDRADYPYQVLNIETSLGVSGEDLIKHLHVYALPKDRPANSFQPMRKDYQWINPGEIMQDILKIADPLQLQLLPEGHPFPEIHRFKFHAAAPCYLFIQVAKGLKGAGGFVLAKDDATVLKAPDYPREIKFLREGSLMAMAGEKKLTVAVRGISEIKLSIGRVLENHLNHLVAQTKGNIQNPQFKNPCFSRDDICCVDDEFRRFDMSDPAEWQYAAIDLEQYLVKGEQSLGLFLLKAQAWDHRDEADSEVEKGRLILITDMDLLVKDNADGTHDLFVHSIAGGMPVVDARIEVMGKNGLPIAKGVTDHDGHVSFPSFEDFKDEREPVAYMARKGNDRSFLPYCRGDRQLNYSRFDVDGMHSASQNRLRAYVFTDRSLYRPGETLHVGAIVKKGFVQDLMPGIPLEVYITDPRGSTVLSQKFALPESGLAAFDYTLPKSALTGQYDINFYIAKDGQLDSHLGYASLRVEEFLPDRLKLQAHFAADKILQNDASASGWLSSDNLKAKVHLWNLFGTPAAECCIKAKMVLAPQPLEFAQYRGYHFVDPLIDPHKASKVFIEELTEAKTDLGGEAVFDLHLDRFGRSTYHLTLIAEAFETDGGHSVTVEASALVTPLQYLAGYKADGDLSFLRQYGKYHVNFIAIDPRLSSIALEHLQLQLFEVKTVSALTKRPDGSYQYQPVREEVPISTEPLDIHVDGTDFRLPTDVLGDYALALSDADHHLLAKFTFSVVGESSGIVQKKAELAVKLDKEVYRPGDTIEMQIAAPYAGSGLITIECDKVYAYRWFQMDSNSTLQSIAIPSEFQGNGYVNVSFVRSWNSDEIFANALSYAVVPFTVSHEEKALNVHLDVPAEIRPGQALPIQFWTDKPARIVIFAVDEGILQAADYQAPDPLAFFFRKQALQVDTWQNADLILPKYEGRRELSAPGGDGRLQLLAMHLNPFKSKREQAVVFWSGIIESDGSPKIVNYQVPEYFNGSLRVMAVASSPDTVGSAVECACVRDDVMIKPRAPAFIAPGDIVAVTATIANLSRDESELPLIVNIAASPEVDILGSSQEELTLQKRQEGLAVFHIKANERLGEAQLTFTAAQGDQTYKIHAFLCVRPAAAYHTRLISGYDDSAMKTIDNDRQLYEEHRRLQAAASSSPFILAHGLNAYLDSYPYDCTEQLISKALSSFVMARQEFFQLNPGEAQEKFKQTIQILRERQTDLGAFSYWPGQAYPNVMATLIAMDYLTEAKRDGYPVPADMFAAGMQYLEKFARDDVERHSRCASSTILGNLFSDFTPSPLTKNLAGIADLAEARLKAYAIYLLARNEVAAANYLTNLHLCLSEYQKGRWEKDITGAYAAAAYQLLQFSEEAGRLIDRYQLRQASNPNPHHEDFRNGVTDDAQYLTLLARHFPERCQKVSREIICALTEGISSNQLNTLSAAYSIRALSAYAENIAMEGNSALSISEVLKDRSEKNLDSSTPFYAQADFDAEAKQLRIHNPAKSTYFYQIKHAGFDKISPDKPLKNGLEIYREYVDSKGSPIHSVVLGGKIEARIHARALNQPLINHIAIVELLPAGFEVVPHSIRQSCCDYVDVREDRIIFYCSLGASADELCYSLQAVNKGEYVIPPIFAQSMYHPQIQAQGVAGRIAVR